METIEIENSLGLSFCERLEIAFTHGEGSYVWDEAGQQYLDFTSGWGVTCLGHAHPTVTQALVDQAANIIQSPNAGFTYSPPRSALLKILSTLLPQGLNRTYFCNSGAEANDAALKLARKITGRSKVISAQGGFHGRTFNTLAVTRGPENSARYFPKQCDTSFVPFGDPLALSRHLDQDTAAVILEPIQGEGGVQIPAADYLLQVQGLCKNNGTLLIVDEVQTEFCRTGKFFAIEHCGQSVQPDFLTMGKGIAGGFPFAAFSVSEDIASKLRLDDYGGTYCGNPLGCAISHAVITTLHQQNIATKVAQSGEHMLAELQALQVQFSDLIKTVRGKGLLCAIEFHDQSLTRPVTHQCATAGLLVVPTRNGIIRLLPDLLVSEENINKAMVMLQKVLRKV